MTPTPFWLEIKTEYIDANLDKVINYLAKEAVNPEHDAFYDETVTLLGRRAVELTDTLSEASIWDADETADKGEALTALRMLGAALLAGAKAPAGYFFFVKTLATIVPASYIDDLTEIAVKSLSYKVEKLGFNWSDIKEVQREILAHKVITAAVFADSPAPEAWFQGKGSVRIKDGVIDLLAKNKEEAAIARLSASLEILEDVIRVQASERIQQKDEDNPEEMDRFTTDFIRDAASMRLTPMKALKTYNSGDVLPVRFKGVDLTGNILVESVEGDHEHIEGFIPAKNQSVLFYTMADFGRFFRTGDCFDARLLSTAKKSFNLGDWFVDSVCNNVVRTCENILAYLKEIKKGKMTWWTADGYPAYSDIEEKPDGSNYNPGEFATIYITGCAANGYVSASVIGPSGESFSEDNSRDYCIGECVYPEETEFAAAAALSIIDGTAIKGLTRLLFAWQRSIGQASERFRILCICRILSAMTDDSIAREYIELSCAYLKNLVAFAAGRTEDIKPICPSERLADVPPVILRADVTRILQAYGVDEDSDYLSGIIHNPDANPLLVQLAKLIQSCNRIDDVYPAIKTVIKREITKFLAVETEDNTDFEEAVGPNFGVENSRQEFKTSFFFAPKNAREQNQEKTIFRSLCSFLNTQEGGTLFLGVNDSGGINGLDSDLEYIQKKVAGNYKGIDGYVRYITDRARQWFDLDVRIHFKIEPLFDGRVVAIHVEPYQHGVVEFDGVPYIRNNSESVKMSQTLRRQIEAKRLQGAQERSTIIIALGEAIREERAVKLFAYASSNSGEINDRRLEPFAFVGNYSYIWAYDLDDDANKLFRISRIGNVKIEGAWTKKAAHKKSPIDIFHFQGDTPIPVKLELDLLAKNLLIEEYPDAQQDLSSLGDGRWLLDTIVRNIYGIGRFYTGLINHISIVDAPELAAFAKTYFAEGLEKLK